MTPAKSIQFTTPAEVLLYYREEGEPAFAVWHNAHRSFRYEGDSIDEGEAKLSEILNTLTRADSAAIYTLALYSRPKNAPEGWLTTKRESELSVNFRLRAVEGMAGVGGNGGGTGVAALLGTLQAQNAQILAALKAQNDRINALEEEDDDEGEESDALGGLGKLLENPQLMSMLGNFLGGGGVPAGKPAAINGVPGQAGEPETLEQAIEVLKKADPDLEKHLVKLARIARQNPRKFSGLVQILETF